MARLSPEDRWDHQPDENGLGLASFIVSIIGLVSAGILSPVGAVMGLIAIRREPRGFAIAGLVIGLLGSIWICFVSALFLAFFGVMGVGLASMVMSLVYTQIEQGLNTLTNASGVIAQWQLTHDGQLPTTEQGTLALQSAGFTGSYKWLDEDDFSIELVIDNGDGDPWTFTAEYAADGDRETLSWRSESGFSHGNWNFD
ncbi:MAG: hypothetical protein HOO04_06020 [Phycisphaerae bacterium]|jgi:hypothetical protein|nr:hypothetical protein [Phycisphaerae bacterium]MBT5383157.1 hypothetical protein [Phycisphaerae bacterium]